MSLLQFLNNGYFAGSVGIGTNSPSAKLHITKDNTTGNALLITNSGSSRSLEINHNADGTGVSDEVVRIMNDGTRLFTIESDGKVGIGIANPSYKLDVDGTFRSTGWSNFATNGPTSIVQMGGVNSTVTQLNLSSSAAGGSYISCTNSLSINVNNNTSLKMLSNGNVGIGVTNPASKLTVGGTASGFSTAMQVWQDGETAASGDIGGKAATFFGESGVSNSSIVNIYSTNGYTGQNGGEIGFGGKYASNASVAQFAKIRSFKTNASNGGANYGGGLEFWTRPNGSAAVPRMTILGDGNVGIGNTNPSDYSADANNLVVGSLTGNNGITILSTASSGYGSIYFADSTTANKVYSGFIRYQQNISDMTFGTNEVERMRLTLEGYLGIGTTNPLSQLSIGSNAITTKKPTVVIADGVAGGSLVIRGLSPILSFDRTGASPENKILMDGVGLEFKTGTLDAEGDVDFKINADGSLQLAKGAKISNQENTDIDSAAAEVVAQVSTTYTAAFFDFVVKKTTNVRSGTVYACHDGTSVMFTETSTNDLGDTSDVTLSVDISGTNMRLLATVTSDDWSVKSLIRAI